MGFYTITWQTIRIQSRILTTIQVILSETENPPCFQEKYENTEYLIVIECYLHIGSCSPNFKHCIFNIQTQFSHCFIYITCLFKAV